MNAETDKPADRVEWASGVAIILVTKKNEIEEWLKKNGRLDAFVKDMGEWKKGYILKSDPPLWDEEALMKASEALYQICQRHGLCEVIETRYQPPKDLFRGGPPVRTRGRMRLRLSAERSLVLETARKRLQELAHSFTK